MEMLVSARPVSGTKVHRDYDGSKAAFPDENMAITGGHTGQWARWGGGKKGPVSANALWDWVTY